MLTNQSFIARALGRTQWIALAASLFIAPIAAHAQETVNFKLSMGEKTWSLQQNRPHVVILVFGYTYCPDVCPTSLGVIASAFDLLEPAERNRVRGVFVSVDPGRDTPADMIDYGKQFHPNIQGVTGTRSEIDQAVELMGVDYAVHDNKNDAYYSVDHSPLMFIIDPRGKKVEAFISHIVPPEALADFIRDLLNDQ